jgi:valyl-tRNA synthetase
VLDTWFSSGLWPFSTLGWPEDTATLKKFYPTQVMETGFDIIFFWVARMIFMGIHFMDEVPFSTVFLHAMVRDKEGAKMSKTKGNVIDPLHLIDGMNPNDIPEEERHQYRELLKDFPDGITPQGADALRFTLSIYAAAGRDIKLDVKRVEGYRAFINKLWNATRFALLTLEDYEAKEFVAADEDLSPADKWILTRLSDCVTAVNEGLTEYRFSDAAQAIYEFTWHEFCDWYLECSKPILYGDDTKIPGTRAAAQGTMLHVLDTILKLAHPFMPFVTEELWQALPKTADAAEVLCISAWPNAGNRPEFRADEAEVAAVITVITGIRRVRGESNVPPSKPLPRVIALSDDPVLRAALEAQTPYIERLAKAEKIEIGTLDSERPENAATTVQAGVEIIIPLEGLVDLGAERIRIEKEIDRVDKDIAMFTKKLTNERFIANAPEAVVAKDRAKLDAAQAKRTTLEAGLGRLN